VARSLFSQLVVALLGLLWLPQAAGAEIVRLTNGRTMTVDYCRFEGDTVVIVFRNGGELRAPRSIVAELLPDEVPFARSAAIEALAASPAATRSQLGEPAIRALIDRVAARVGIDARLAHAVVQAESNYNPLAVSPVGAMGLMQLMPSVARQYGVEDPFDAETNLEAGMRHLRVLQSRLPDTRRVLAAYNAGESAVVRYGGVPPYRETQSYVSRIMALLVR